MTDNAFHSANYATRRTSYLPYWLRLRIHEVVARYIAPIARHPAMTLITGVGLLLSGLMEAFAQIFTDFESLIGPREGVILLGTVTFFKGIADLVEASEWLSRGVEEEREQEECDHH
jgi:hypothetical protein